MPHNPADFPLLLFFQKTCRLLYWKSGRRLRSTTRNDARQSSLQAVCFLLLFATSNAQEITKEKEPARFGIGIAYGFKDRVKELIHPIELTVRYNLSEKHSFYVNVPLGWKSWRDDYASVDPVIRGYYTHKMRLYGLGIGYD